MRLPVPKVLGQIAYSTGILLIIAGRVYHIVVRPEWTEAQALTGLWQLWLFGVLLGCSGIYVTLYGRNN